MKARPAMSSISAAVGNRSLGGVGLAGDVIGSLYLDIGIVVRCRHGL
jgi:hypothetical protein